MNTLAKTLAILLILIAGSHNMLGQSTLLVNDLRPLLAYSSNIESEIELSAELTASSYQFYMEEKVQLENWMIEQSEWVKGTAADLANAIAIDPETEIAEEPWMIQLFSRNGAETWEFLVEVIEEPLEVRKWMICCADWNLKTMQGKAMQIPAITLE